MRAADRQQLGAIANLAFSRTVLVIDNDAANEKFGAINAVDTAASSVCEALARLLGDAAMANADVATCLLAGMTAKTRGFRTADVSPATLELAGKLTAAGARRAEIVDRLYRATPLASMKLWGRALSRLKHDPAARVAWTVLIRQDMAQTGAGDGDLGGLVDQLLANAEGVDVAAVTYEREVGNGAVECWAVVGSDKYPSLDGILPPESGTERLGRHRHARVGGTDAAAAEKTFVPRLTAHFARTPAMA
jgi:phosphoesterase RecJ-like protein